LDTYKNLAKPETQTKLRFPGGRFGLSVLGFAAVNAAIFSFVVSTNWSFPGGSVDQDVLSKNLSQSPCYGTWTWWAAHGYFAEKKAPDVVLMGSSLVNSACWSADAVTTKSPIDCALHHRVVTLEKRLKEKLFLNDPTVLNVSVQGAGACDYYMMTRGLMEGPRKPKVLVLGIAPRDFIDNKMHNLGDTEPFMFYLRYVKFDEAVARAYTNPLLKAMGEIEWRIGRLPLRRFHSAVAGHLTDDGDIKKTRKQSGNQLRVALSNSALRVFPGDIVVPALVPEGCYDNSAEYASRYKNPHPEHFKNQLFFFEEMLKRMKAQDIKVLVVDMPTMTKNRAMLPIPFWSDYTTKINDICARQNAEYLFLSASEDFVKKDFVDTVHVSFRGGAKLLNIIADEIARRRQLSSVLQKSMLSSKKPAATN
jgi:hypothetical protein